jgi:hypothetical protein
LVPFEVEKYRRAALMPSRAFAKRRVTFRQNFQKEKERRKLMPEPIAFKSGRDLGEETVIGLIERVTCVACGKVETDDRAYEEGWQIDPVVCPDCLHWTLTAEGECCAGGAS